MFPVGCFYMLRSCLCLHFVIFLDLDRRTTGDPYKVSSDLYSDFTNCTFTKEHTMSPKSILFVRHAQSTGNVMTYD